MRKKLKLFKNLTLTALAFSAISMFANKQTFAWYNTETVKTADDEYSKTIERISSISAKYGANEMAKTVIYQILQTGLINKMLEFARCHPTIIVPMGEAGGGYALPDPVELLKFYQDTRWARIVSETFKMNDSAYAKYIIFMVFLNNYRLYGTPCPEEGAKELPLEKQPNIFPIAAAPPDATIRVIPEELKPYVKKLNFILPPIEPIESTEKDKNKEGKVYDKYYGAVDLHIATVTTFLAIENALKKENLDKKLKWYRFSFQTDDSCGVKHNGNAIMINGNDKYFLEDASKYYSKMLSEMFTEHKTYASKDSNYIIPEEKIIADDTKYGRRVPRTYYISDCIPDIIKLKAVQKFLTDLAEKDIKEISEPNYIKKFENLITNPKDDKKLKKDSEIEKIDDAYALEIIFDEKYIEDLIRKSFNSKKIHTALIWGSNSDKLENQPYCLDDKKLYYAAMQWAINTIRLFGGNPLRAYVYLNPFFDEKNKRYGVNVTVDLEGEFKDYLKQGIIVCTSADLTKNEKFTGVGELKTRLRETYDGDMQKIPGMDDIEILLDKNLDWKKEKNNEYYVKIYVSNGDEKHKQEVPSDLCDFKVKPQEKYYFNGLRREKYRDENKIDVERNTVLQYDIEQKKN